MRVSYLLPLLICSCVHQEKAQTFSCLYQNEAREQSHESQCGTIDRNGKISLNKANLEKVRFQDGLTCLWVKKRQKWSNYYLNEAGQMKEVYSYDNGCDYFQEGLARTHVNGKLAYMNRDLDIKLETAYDWGAPFSSGAAKVCNDVVWETKGEHKSMTSANCVMIDKNGRLSSAAK
ncbi:WG repeat-containing protein [Pseudobacteriovorax antillogorgiicola]|uniref:Uncharacterized protein n=1 Tax=Pseudobacteriovorax antillogorgiicola TaxID=1513793 RepID=A0A1Y6BG02_9BACT|nr:WG repeat-containing protein [Pseudobacteriovorax antillogorgiicola]TCS57408.1 hypothetical protein EDD56_103148 [Pseudobacteriovorax antillogorgiicola]SMF01529.1 hypothetical protein SAMN06296036_103185 [Pseudobacteriovorax antillogorgiicola]